MRRPTFAGFCALYACILCRLAASSSTSLLDIFAPTSPKIQFPVGFGPGGNNADGAFGGERAKKAGHWLMEEMLRLNRTRQELRQELLRMSVHRLRQSLIELRSMSERQDPQARIERGVEDEGAEEGEQESTTLLDSPDKIEWEEGPDPFPDPPNSHLLHTAPNRPIMANTSGEATPAGSVATVKTKEDLRLVDVPSLGKMRIPEFQLENRIVFPYEYVSYVVRLLQPSIYPTGLVRAVLASESPASRILFQAIPVEFGFITVVVLGCVLAFILPCGVAAQSCRIRASSNQRLISEGEEEATAAPTVTIATVRCLLILLFCGAGIMAGSNESFSSALDLAPDVLEAGFADLSSFIQSVHSQVRFVISNSADQVVDDIFADLDSIEELLGKPVQSAIAVETGVDVALDSLMDIDSANQDISEKVSALRQDSLAAKEEAKECQERLKELRRQVEMVKQQCLDRDRPLCTTVNTEGLDVSFRIEKLVSDRRLRELGKDNLTSAVTASRSEFQTLPQRVAKDVADHRAEIKNALSRQRDELYDKVQDLEHVSRSLVSTLADYRAISEGVLREIIDADFWRWLACIISSAGILMIWLLMALGAVQCCGLHGWAAPALVAGVVVACTASLALWAVALMALLLGGHGDYLVCRPLYEQPDYEVITELFDAPNSPLYDLRTSFLGVLHEDNTFDVPFRSIVRDCQFDQPVFTAFKLHHFFESDSSRNSTWPDLRPILANITANLSDVKILNAPLRRHLQELSMATRVNLTTYRSQLHGGVTTKDLNSFANQLESVARQISDAATTARMDSLAAKARKLYKNNVMQLERRRDDIIYKLTALEFKLVPMQRQVNQTLSHLKTIQYYISNQGAAIANQKSEEFRNKLLTRMTEFKADLLTQLYEDIGTCRTLYDVFHAWRTTVCRLTLDPLNTFWVSDVCCLLLLIALAPLCLRIVHGKIVDRQLSRSHRPSSDPLIPPPPRLPDTLRRPSPRHPRVSPRRRPLQESLRMAEQPSTWISPGRSPAPRGWL